MDIICTNNKTKNYRKYSSNQYRKPIKFEIDLTAQNNGNYYYKIL